VTVYVIVLSSIIYYYNILYCRLTRNKVKICEKGCLKLKLCYFISFPLIIKMTYDKMWFNLF